MLASDDGWLYVIDGGDATGAPTVAIRFGETACAAGGGATRAPDGQFQSRVLDLRQPTTIYNMSWNTSLAPGQPLTLTLSYRTSNDPAFPGVPFSNTISVASGISQTGQISIRGRRATSSTASTCSAAKTRCSRPPTELGQGDL